MPSTPDRASFTGLILAGGRSRRFGADKAWHRIEGLPMIKRVHAAVTPVVARVLVSVGPQARPTWPWVADQVTDRHADAGPLAGLHAGLVHMETPWLLAVACDLPHLTAADLALLIQACSPGTAAVVAVDADGRDQPLCACYHRDVLPTAEDHLADGRYALYALLRQIHPTVRVALPAHALHNINRPSDLTQGATTPPANADN